MRTFHYNPHPKNMVVIREHQSYTVPAGKIFVLTALGTMQFWNPSDVTRLYANGVLAISGGIFGKGVASTLAGTELYGPFCSLAAVPDCITFPAGTILQAVGQFPLAENGRAWGYLAAA